MRIPVIALMAVSFFSTAGHAQVDVPGRVEAENYTSFNDTTRGNSGRKYRSDDVDIQLTTDAGGGHNVGWIAKGESLSYPINVEQDGRYRVTLRVASLKKGGAINVYMDGKKLRNKPVKFSATRGWQRWRNSSFVADLRSGEQTLKLEFLKGGFNVNYIDIEWVGTATLPARPKPVDPKPVDPKPVDPKPVDPKPVDPPSASTCSFPYFVDTLGRCVKPFQRNHVSVIVYCEYPSSGFASGVLGADPRSYPTRCSRGFPVLTEATPQNCPAPYELNGEADCVLNVTKGSQNLRCPYPFTIGVDEEPQFDFRVYYCDDDNPDLVLD